MVRGVPADIGHWPDDRPRCRLLPRLYSRQHPHLPEKVSTYNIGLFPSPGRAGRIGLALPAPTGVDLQPSQPSRSQRSKP
jgi:hypothetical protein